MLEELAIGLVMIYSKERVNEFQNKNYRHVSRSLINSFEQVGVQVKRLRDNSASPSTVNSPRRRCYLCENGNKSSKTCLTCNKPVCNKHSEEEKKVVCNPCMEN